MTVTLPIIISEIEKMPAADLRRLLYLLLDKILAVEKTVSQENGKEPSIRKYRGVAKGI